MNTLRNDELYEHSYVKIRFIGEGLDAQGIPIYDLGQSFIAFQRIINKAYLFKNQQLTKGTALSTEERKICALQIIARKKESDGYGLAPFLTDPAYGDIIKGLIVVGVSAIAAYTKRKLFPPKDQNSLSPNILIGSIKNEVNIFVDRIDNVGGVNSIQISPGRDLNFETLHIDKETQEYVRGLSFETILGEVMTIEGVVTRIHPRRMTLDIKDRPNHYITIHVSESDFDKIRKSTNLRNYMRFYGRPIYKYGTETPEFDEFEAHKVDITKRKHIDT